MPSRKVALATLAIPAALVAQTPVRDYGVHVPKDQAALEQAGIGSYHLTREGEAIKAEVYDAGGAPLASCEGAWLAESTVFSCEVFGRGEYRFTIKKDFARLDRLDTNDWVEWHTAPKPADWPERFSLEPGKQLALPTREVTTSGSISISEVAAAWGSAPTVVSLTAAEIELTLGLEGPSRFERIAAPMRSSRSSLAPEGTTSFAQNTVGSLGTAPGSGRPPAAGRLRKSPTSSAASFRAGPAAPTLSALPTA